MAPHALGIELHLRVALRKLRGQSQSTFRVRPSDRGMEVIAVPPAVHTRPQFNQALRVSRISAHWSERTLARGSRAASGDRSWSLAMLPKISLLDELRKGGYEASLITTYMPICLSTRRSCYDAW